MCGHILLAAQCLFAVAEVIPGGVDQWGSLAEGKTSSQLVDVLLEEIGTGALREKWLPCMGMWKLSSLLVSTEINW